VAVGAARPRPVASCQLPPSTGTGTGSGAGAGSGSVATPPNPRPGKKGKKQSLGPRASLPAPCPKWAAVQEIASPKMDDRSALQALPLHSRLHPGPGRRSRPPRPSLRSKLALSLALVQQPHTGSAPAMLACRRARLPVSTPASPNRPLLALISPRPTALGPPPTSIPTPQLGDTFQRWELQARHAASARGRRVAVASMAVGMFHEPKLKQLQRSWP